MKRIIICLIAMSLIITGFDGVVLAKTTRKSSKNSSTILKTKSITPEDFISFDKESGQYGPKTGEEICKLLKSKGFKIKKVAHESYYFCFEAYPSSGSSDIKEIICDDEDFTIISIIFKSTHDAADFYNKIKKYNNYDSYGEETSYCWELNGNDVSCGWLGMP